jgi:hypothetical protein
MKTKRFTLPSLLTVLTFIIIAFLIYAFFSGITMRFYASLTFLFYSLVGRMWIAVVLLGISQAFLMIPLRIINLKLSSNINEFKERLEQLKSDDDQAFYIKQHMRTGDKTALYYSIDFMIQTISYISIGRLFLTDFYSQRLNPRFLYSFVPYPSYPIEGRFFFIPYPYFSKTIDLGFKAVLAVWFIILVTIFALRMARYIRQVNKSVLPENIDKSESFKSAAKYFGANIFLVLLLSWLLVRNFPAGWKIGIFSGDISIPNRRFNTITAVVTTLTILWFGINKIKRKTNLAISKNVDPNVIDETQKNMFRETLRSSIILGLGAFFITNQIPCAFELSIFTFELIAILSPFTLDKLIVKTAQPPPSQNQDKQTITAAL